AAEAMTFLPAPATASAAMDRVRATAPNPQHAPRGGDSPGGGRSPPASGPARGAGLPAGGVRGPACGRCWRCPCFAPFLRWRGKVAKPSSRPDACLAFLLLGKVDDADPHRHRPATDRPPVADVAEGATGVRDLTQDGSTELVASLGRGRIAAHEDAAAVG